MENSQRDTDSGKGVWKSMNTRGFHDSESLLENEQ